LTNVLIPSPLRSYTGNRPQVAAAGATVAEILGDLDRRYPGIRFRMVDEQDGIRPHIKIFVNREQVRQLGAPVAASDEVLIITAISGG
jgi:sulfur-carrier protein